MKKHKHNVGKTVYIISWIYNQNYIVGGNVIKYIVKKHSNEKFWEPMYYVGNDKQAFLFVSESALYETVKEAKKVIEKAKEESLIKLEKDFTEMKKKIMGC